MSLIKSTLGLLAVAAMTTKLSAQTPSPPPTEPRPAIIRVDLNQPIHTMRGGIGASWHAIGPTPYYYPDLIGRNNRECRGSAFGGNPPLEPQYDQAWADLLHHARWLGLDFIRVEISLRMFNPERNQYTWDNDEMRTLDRILQFCQTNHVDVYLTMMHQDVEWNAHPGVCRLQSSPRSVADFAKSYATLLARLVQTNGYSCIQWVTVNNEPGMGSGWWQGPDKQADSIMPAIHALRAALDQRGLQAVAISGPDGHRLRWPGFDPQDPAVGALSLHDYGNLQSMHKSQEAVAVAQARGVPFFLAEFGYFFAAPFEGDRMALGGPRSEAPKSYSAQMLNAEKVLTGLNQGVDGFNRWSFVNRGDLDGQWQMVRTWNPNTWDFYHRVTPEPVPYYCYGILTRFAAKHSTILRVTCPDPNLMAAALQSPQKQITLYLLNESPQPQRVDLQLEGLNQAMELRRYEVTESALAQPTFRLTPREVLTASPTNHELTVELPGESITACTTFQLTNEADGITQE